MKRILLYLLTVLMLGISGSICWAEPENDDKTQEPSEKEETQKTLPLSSEGYDKILTGNKVVRTISEKNTDDSLHQTIKNIVTPLNVIIAVVALIWLLVLAAKFIVGQGNEDKISSYKKQFGWIAVGLGVVSVAEYAAFTIFDPSSKDVLAPEAYNDFSFKLRQAVTYFQYIIAGIALIMIGISGYNFIVHSNDDEAINREKRIINSFGLGLVIILMAEAGVYLVAGGPQGGELDTEYVVKRGIGELAGILNFVLSFMGAAAVFMLILASFYYVTSMGQEDQMNRAKRIIIASIIAIIVAFSSYVLANFLIQ